MALKEGRCTNCGSILNLDPAAEKGHCLFCDAVFDNKTAFEVAANPQGVEFPNLPQPKYEGPNLDPKAINASGLPANRPKQAQQVKKSKPAPLYVPNESIKMPDMRVSFKTKIIAIIVAVVVLGIIAAISVPVVMNRDNTRTKIMASMSTVAPFSVDVEKDVAISRLSNSYLLIASDAAVSKDDMLTLYKNYCAKRAEIQNISLSNFGKAYGEVTVKLVSPDGGYLIDHPADQVALDNGTALVELK